MYRYKLFMDKNTPCSQHVKSQCSVMISLSSELFCRETSEVDLSVFVNTDKLISEIFVHKARH